MGSTKHSNNAIFHHVGCVGHHDEWQKSRVEEGLKTIMHRGSYVVPVKWSDDMLHIYKVAVYIPLNGYAVGSVFIQYLKSPSICCEDYIVHVL